MNRRDGTALESPSPGLRPSRLCRRATYYESRHGWTATTNYLPPHLRKRDDSHKESRPISSGEGMSGQIPPGHDGRRARVRPMTRETGSNGGNGRGCERGAGWRSTWGTSSGAGGQHPMRKRAGRSSCAHARRGLFERRFIDQGADAGRRREGEGCPRRRQGDRKLIYRPVCCRSWAGPSTAPNGDAEEVVRTSPKAIQGDRGCPSRPMNRARKTRLTAKNEEPAGEKHATTPATATCRRTAEPAALGDPAHLTNPTGLPTVRRALDRFV